MAKVCDLKQHRLAFFRSSLEALYIEITAYGAQMRPMRDKLTEDEIRKRIQFFRRMKGQFIRLFRIKNGVTIESVAKKTGLTLCELDKFEAGDGPISDPAFFKICNLVGAEVEVSVFLERMEEAYHPGLREARMELLAEIPSVWLSHPGSSKTEPRPRGRLLSLPARKKDDEGDSQ